MKQLKNPILWMTVLLQIAGPFLFGFDKWANVIQYASGFGMSFAIYEYLQRHRKEVRHLKEQIAHLHDKYDRLMEELRKHE